ncbi:MAG: hypothetical protein A2X32_11185 [Elusimicrobia bacterium GWC2_64_44]|nr:MAG: hypothetical protein A2X32_11185 [Elusimicrobia bacterium GWC2_64_44]
MKKIIIGVVVLLAAALIGLKFFASKEQAAVQRPASQDGQQEQQGVALPSAAKDYSAVATESVYVPTQAMGSYEMFTLPAPVMALKGACEGGSPKEIMEAHGKTWGHFTGRRAAFDTNQKQEIYTYIASYYSCLALARQDITTCNELPGETEANGFKITLDDSPLGLCRGMAADMLFRAYVAGKAKDQQNCLAYIGQWEPTDQGRVSAPEFCEAAAKGPEKFTEYGREKMPQYFGIGEKMMAFTKKVCGSDPVCLANNGLWEGIRTGSPGKCPPAKVPHCTALAEKNQAPCVDIIMEMSRRYCVHYKALVKGSGGYMGMTPDEVKEDLRLKAQKKAEEEKTRKELDVITKQTNERVRKLIGKQGGE